MANSQTTSELTDTSTRASSPDSETDLDDDSSSSCPNKTEGLAPGGSTTVDSGKAPVKSSLDDSQNTCTNSDKNPTKPSCSNSYSSCLKNTKPLDESFSSEKSADDQALACKGCGESEEKTPYDAN